MTTTWTDFAVANTELAATVRRCFGVRKHATMATLRRDGAPRISGTELVWDDAGLRVGMMPGTRRAADLRRDPRVAVHSPTHDTDEDNPGSWLGEAKVSGRARDVTDSSSADPVDWFVIDPEEVVHTCVDPAGQHLVVTTWHPVRGVQQHRRG
ncbi:pyridoxamine 5'-phosphate oxidase family protein [Rhodococcus sp. X156]|uniref:pyridoxamine 5'-phosphate oxidase family protein n=1 Tax=Rhodococcus sp. X156 TaxID=2499145 RepID=UPI000FDA262A|nr:pyridoxamine 5'-phosphate oxidase family protein [Rhodococcus sp. X156]